MARDLLFQRNAIRTYRAQARWHAERAHDYEAAKQPAIAMGHWQAVTKLHTAADREGDPEQGA